MSQPDARPARLATHQTNVLRETVSQAGHAVRMALNCGVYQGARPYYRVRYAGRGRATRYTPSLARAECLFQQFQHDLTDPSALRSAETTKETTP